MIRTLLALLLFSLPAFGQGATANWVVTRQTMLGFGASDANTSGRLMSAAQRTQMFGLTPPQIGLSVIRIPVTSGSQDPGSCTSVGASCAGSYTADAQAVANNGGLVIASPFTAPAAYKTNGSNVCTGTNTGQLAAGHYADFATWEVNFIKSIASVAGVTLYAIDMQQEPNACGSGFDQTFWSDTEIDTYIKNNLGPAISAASLTTKIYMPETYNYGRVNPGITGFGDTCAGDSGCSSLVSAVAFHDYDALATNSPNSANAANNPYSSAIPGYWITEVSCVSNGGGHSGPSGCETGQNTDMGSDGLLWANLLDDRIVNRNAQMYLYWQFVQGFGNNDDEALCLANGTTPKRCYVFGQYSQFVRPGYVRIDATHNPQTNVYISSYQNVSTPAWVTVATNYGNAINQQVCLINGPSFAMVAQYVTSSSQSMAQGSNISVNNDCFTATLAAQSVTTFVASGTSTPTFFISKTFGSDSNTGTCKAASGSCTGPWQHAPGMASVTGTAAAHVPQPGETFVLMGCDVWTNADLSLTWNWSGSGANSMIYVGGAPNQNWFNSTNCPSGWNRPILDGGNATVGSQNVFVYMNQNYVTLDNIEMRNMQMTTASNSQCFGCSTFVQDFGAVGTHIWNNYFHGVHFATNNTVQDNLNMILGSTNVTGNSPSQFQGLSLRYNIFNCADCSAPPGRATYGYQGEVAFNYCGHMSNCFLYDFASFHDNLMENLQGDCVWSPSCGHPNAMESGNDIPYGWWANGSSSAFPGVGALYYNNVVRHLPVGFGIVGWWPMPCLGNTTYAWNNVIYDTSDSNVYNIMGGGQPTCGFTPNNGAYVDWNETLECGPDSNPQAGCSTGINFPTSVKFYNRHQVTGSSPADTGSSITVNAYPPNLLQTKTVANNAGYTSAQTFAFSPIASGSPTVGRGTNFTAQCVAPFQTLCADTTYGVSLTTSPTGELLVSAPARNSCARPTTGAWDTGAYIFNTNCQAPPPVPIITATPGTIAFGTQTVSTSSNPQTSVIANVGNAPASLQLPFSSSLSDFTFTTNCPASLVAGASCNVVVTFTPTTTGLLSGQINITNNAAQSPQVILVNGTGSTAAPPVWSHKGQATPVKCSSGTTCNVTISPTPTTGQTILIAGHTYNGTSSPPTISSVQDANGNSFTVSTHSVCTGQPVNAGAPYAAFMISVPANFLNPVTVTTASATQDTAVFADSFQVSSGYTVTIDNDACGSGTTGSPSAPSITPASSADLFYSEAIPFNHINSIGTGWTGTANQVLGGPPNAVPIDGAGAAYAMNVSSALAVAMTASSSNFWASIELALQANPTSSSTPSLTSLSVTSATEGSTVTANGANLGASQGGSTITVNGVTQTVQTWSATAVKFTLGTPSSTGNVVVTVGGTSSNGILLTVLPSLSSLSVNSGITGAQVTATGTGFGSVQGSAGSVQISGITCSIISWSDASIVFTIPSTVSPGVNLVTVTQGGNTSSGQNFIVSPNITSLSITSGLVGTQFTITGTALGASPTINFGAIAGTLNPGNTNLSISTSVPASATPAPYNVSVTSAGLTSNSKTFTVTANPPPPLPPIISAVNPQYGVPGVLITFTGQNFGPTPGTSTVTFGSVQANLLAPGVVWSSTSITVPVPTLNVGTYSIQVNVGGQSSNKVTINVIPFWLLQVTGQFSGGTL